MTLQFCHTPTQQVQALEGSGTKFPGVLQFQSELVRGGWLGKLTHPEINFIVVLVQVVNQKGWGYHNLDDIARKMGYRFPEQPPKPRQGEEDPEAKALSEAYQRRRNTALREVRRCRTSLVSKGIIECKLSNKWVGHVDSYQLKMPPQSRGQIPRVEQPNPVEITPKPGGISPQSRGQIPLNPGANPPDINNYPSSTQSTTPNNSAAEHSGDIAIASDLRRFLLGVGYSAGSVEGVISQSLSGGLTVEDLRIILTWVDGQTWVKDRLAQFRTQIKLGRNSDALTQQKARAAKDACEANRLAVFTQGMVKRFLEIPRDDRLRLVAIAGLAEPFDPAQSPAVTEEIVAKWNHERPQGPRVPVVKKAESKRGQGIAVITPDELIGAIDHAGEGL